MNSTFVQFLPAAIITRKFLTFIFQLFMSSQPANVSPRCTCTRNATTWPGQIQLDADIAASQELHPNGKKKQRTKASKANDPPKESPEEEAAKLQQAAERMAEVEEGMKQAEEEQRAKKPEAPTDEEDTEEMGKKRKKPTEAIERPSLRDAIKNIHSMSALPAPLPGCVTRAEDEKGNKQLATSKFTLSGHVKNWAISVKAARFDTSGTPTASSTTSHHPPPSTYSQVSRPSTVSVGPPIPSTPINTPDVPTDKHGKAAVKQTVEVVPASESNNNKGHDNKGHEDDGEDSVPNTPIPQAWKTTR
ncbi:hypothetical protein BV22DRAFT_1134584 [Leucogyrophana mollusca]|uniref:Uncharacterized protein n=1 Tax=Leucogyrophana mollusca TaxID=85980 RepID=A0ACB8AY45_9AGAM|nr:hypothetical protein BV22DRAFT_1134584 [Leucogyrophana mollusca]